MSVTSLVCLFRAVLRPQLSILERSLKGALEQDIRTMRRFHFPDLSEGLTEDQKADIHRRFDELQTYTLTPTNFPFGRLDGASATASMPDVASGSSFRLT